MAKIEGSLNRDGQVSFVAAGGAAGAITVTGIKVSDTLLSVINLTDQVDLSSEFTITAVNTIDNTGGTDTTGDKLQVFYSSAN